MSVKPSKSVAHRAPPSVPPFIIWSPTRTVPESSRLANTEAEAIERARGFARSNQDACFYVLTPVAAVEAADRAVEIHVTRFGQQQMALAGLEPREAANG